MFRNVKNIIFDFDGVIIDSMSIRTQGFREILKLYDENLVEKLINYHNQNGGLSRFNKIKYFYNEVLGKEITNKEIEEYSNKFSIIMKKKLISKEVLINETIEFIKNNYNKFNMHIASGSEENELVFLCEQHKIDKYFKSIHGSPTPKVDLIRMILEKNKYLREETIIIGDSINDFQAAQINNIGFFGYNNLNLSSKGNGYIYKF